MEESLLEKLKKVFLDIRNKQFSPYYFIYGEEHFFIASLENNIKKSFDDPTKMNVKTFDSENFDKNEVIKYIVNMPFMNEKKLIIFKDVDIFRKKSEEKELIEALTIGKESNIVLVLMPETERKYEEKYTKTNTLFDFFNKNGIIINSKKLADNDVSKYIVNKFKKASIDIDKVEIAYFIKIVGRNLLNVFNEADKLISYMDGKTKVERSDIDECISKNIEDNVFKLIDFINLNKQSEALTLYGDLISEGVSAFSLISFFTSNYKDLLIVKDLTENSKSIKEICEITKYPDWKVKKLIDANKSITKENIERKLSKITKLSTDQMRGDINESLLIELLLY